MLLRSILYCNEVLKEASTCCFLVDIFSDIFARNVIYKSYSAPISSIHLQYKLPSYGINMNGRQNTRHK